jgi:hypothetical protein
MRKRIIIFSILLLVTCEGICGKLTPLVEENITNDALKYIKIGEKIYLYKYDPTEGFKYEKDRFECDVINQVEISKLDNHAILVNNREINPKRAYVRIDGIYINLYYWLKSGQGKSECCLETSADAIFFDSQGRYHEPDAVYVGNIGEQKIALAYTHIDGKIIGNYKYLMSQRNSKVFTGNIKDDKIINLVTIDSAGIKKFKGDLNSGEIDGSWIDSEKSENMKIFRVDDVSSISGKFVRINSDGKTLSKGNLYLALSDSGTFHVFLEFKSSGRDDFVSGIGYLDNDRRLEWKPENDLCWRPIAFKSNSICEMGDAPCHGPHDVDHFIGGIYRRDLKKKQ